MADRFKFMALNAPSKCNISMCFDFNCALPIKTFLEKIDLPNLFHNVSYWQGAQYKFKVHGVDRDNNFVDEECDIWISMHKYTLATATDAIYEGFVGASKHFYNELPLVSKLYISYGVDI